MNALERYQARRGGMKDVWKPPVIAEFAQDIRVLSFDQTLRRTGFVLLSVSDGEVHVHERMTARLHSDLKSFEESFDLAEKLWTWLEFNINISIPDLPSHHVVYEMPAVMGKRTESSLLAAYVVRDWSKRRCWTSGTMISIQQSRTILGGSLARNDKHGGHEALGQYIPGSTRRTWNEHQRDAAINGLAYLYLLKQGGAR